MLAEKRTDGIERAVFAADVAYVALLDRAAGTIGFPYQYGEQQETLRYGEGLTSRIIDSGEAIGAARAKQERTHMKSAKK